MNVQHYKKCSFQWFQGTYNTYALVTNMYNYENNATSEAQEQYKQNKHMSIYVFISNQLFYNQYTLKYTFAVLVDKSKTNYP